MKKKITIIVPHFNNLCGLKKLLASIPICEFIDVVVVDDDSPGIRTNLIRLAEEYNNCKLHISEKNVGAGGCRNIGLTYVNSDWVLFADSDDYFTENAFEIFNSFSNSKYDVIFFKAESINLDTREKGQRSLNLNELVNNLIINGDESIRYASAVPWGKMIKSSLIFDNNINFDEVVCSNDVFFSMKLGHLATRIIGSESYVYVVTRREGSLTTTKTSSYLLCRLMVTIKVNQYLAEINKKKYQASFVKLLLSYRKILTFKILLILFKKVLIRELVIFPDKVFRKGFLSKVKDIYNNVH